MASLTRSWTLRLFQKQTTLVTGNGKPCKSLAYIPRRGYKLAASSGSSEVPEDTQVTEEPRWRPKLVIFDKNGTLIDFHKIWTPWVNNLTRRIEEMTGLNLEQRICSRLDICHFTKKTRPGILAEGTTSQIKRHLEDLLQDIGFSCRKSQLIVERCWKDCDTSEPSTLEQVADLKVMFEELRDRGIKIAVLTSDNRKSTERTLGKLDLDPYIDLVLCGDDHLSVDDSRGARIKYVCQRVGVKPKDAVMVGDTEDDVRNGREAEVGQTVGVLSGIGTRLDLAPHADLVVDTVKEAIPLVINGMQQQTKAKQNGSSKSKVSLVIFDKDGTLICFNSMWTPWAKSLAKRLDEVSGLKIAHKTLSELGYCHLSQKWKPGIFAESTTIQNRQVIQQVLEGEGVMSQEARDMVDRVWQDGDHSGTNEHLKPLVELSELFQLLHKHGIKIAVCTADSRQSTEQFLRSQQAEEYVDMLVCGDDPDAEPKPSAHNALKICEALGIEAEGAVVVGDTVADLGMGREAKLGATVAVLSGVGQVEDLDAQADVMLHSIKQLLPLVIPQQTGTHRHS